MQRIVGFNFEKIHAERKKPPKGKIQITSNINIKSIEQEKLDIAKEHATLKFNFEFSINYKPNLAELTFQGFVLGLFEKNKTKEVLKKWKNKKIQDEIRIPLFNFILTKCNLKALDFEQEFGLPPHIPLPKISKTNNAKYAG